MVEIIDDYLEINRPREEVNYFTSSLILYFKCEWKKEMLLTRECKRKTRICKAKLTPVNQSGRNLYV